MYHAHTTDTTLQCKVIAIIDCYFQSSVPPRLQLDIPVSVGEQVVKRGAAGPYIFREAQVYSIRIAHFSHALFLSQLHVEAPAFNKYNAVIEAGRCSLDKRL